MLLFSTHHLVCQRSCSFHAYPFTRSVVPFAQVLFALSSLASLFNRSAVWDLSYPLLHSFNSSGGSVLWFHQVSSHLIKTLFNSFLSNRSAARVWSFLIPFCNRSVLNIYLPFNLKVSQCSLSLVSNGVFSTLFSFVLFFSRISSTWQGSLVSLVRQRSNLVLPLLSFSSVVPPVPF